MFIPKTYGILEKGDETHTYISPCSENRSWEEL